MDNRAAAAESGFALTLSPRDGHWCWRVLDIDGQERAIGIGLDRDAAWRSGLSAAGALDGASEP
jgi:hypothetical protein